MSLCTASRALCWLMTGHWLMVCSMAHALEWRRFTMIIDAAFRLIRNERDHCRAMWAHDAGLD